MSVASHMFQLIDKSFITQKLSSVEKVTLVSSVYERNVIIFQGIDVHPEIVGNFCCTKQVVYVPLHLLLLKAV